MSRCEKRIRKVPNLVTVHCFESVDRRIGTNPKPGARQTRKTLCNVGTVFSAYGLDSARARTNMYVHAVRLFGTRRAIGDVFGAIKCYSHVIILSYFTAILSNGSSETRVFTIILQCEIAKYFKIKKMIRMGTH